MAKKMMITAMVGAATAVAAMLWSDHNLNRPQPPS